MANFPWSAHAVLPLNIPKPVPSVLFHSICPVLMLTAVKIASEVTPTAGFVIPVVVTATPVSKSHVLGKLLNGQVMLPIILVVKLVLDPSIVQLIKRYDPSSNVCTSRHQLLLYTIDPGG